MGNVIEANDETFDREVLTADRPVLVDFGATWCGPCKALAPIVASIADERAATLKVVAVDLDEAPAIAKRYGIRGAPTLLLFARGEKVARHVGLTSKEKLLAFVASAQPT